MGRTEDWAWLCEWCEEEEARVRVPPVTSGQAFVAGFVMGVALAMIALVVGWAVSA